MNLSEVMAGVTLLALANGATDIITVFVASENEIKQGDNLAIGNLFGSSIYSFTIVLAYVIYNSRKGVISYVNLNFTRVYIFLNP
jgi:Ca2+/Na+ antiporter